MSENSDFQQAELGVKFIRSPCGVVRIIQLVSDIYYINLVSEAMAHFGTGRRAMSRIGVVSFFSSSFFFAASVAANIWE